MFCCYIFRELELLEEGSADLKQLFPIIQLHSTRSEGANKFIVVVIGAVFISPVFISPVGICAVFIEPVLIIAATALRLKQVCCYNI